MKNNDFTLSTYKQLLQELRKANYLFLTLAQYCSIKNLPECFIILRHDVDRTPKNSLKTALIEAGLKIKSSYYFRIGKQSNKPEIIKQIVELGHEIGYHYEDLAMANGNYQKAIKTFKNNLEYFRKFYPIKTMCMHGSPLSRVDNRDLWKVYNYRDYGIIGEPYFDIDFNRVLYLTDTGRKWNGASVSIRDKVNSNFNYNFKTTDEIILALKNNELPNQIMINIHPHRWTDSFIPWTKELIGQNIKNIIKSKIVKLHK